MTSTPQASATQTPTPEHFKQAVIHERRRPRGLRAGLKVLAGATVLALAAAPLVLSTAVVAGAADPSALLAARPWSSGLIAAGLLLWGAFLGLPAIRMLARLGHQRTIHLLNDAVAIHERHLLWGERRWQVPHRDFAGVAHTMRAGLSGVRHELMLVHDDRRKSVVVHRAPMITQALLDEAARTFGVPKLATSAAAKASRERANAAMPASAG
ncbi:MAG: hypothetical protein AAFR04_10290 [Pseudomonadota bacterium]